MGNRGEIMITRDGSVTYWNGRPMMWFEDGKLLVVADLWVEVRGFGFSWTEPQILADVQHVLGEIPVRLTHH
jgi:hypothetical protein